MIKIYNAHKTSTYLVNDISFEGRVLNGQIIPPRDMPWLVNLLYRSHHQCCSGSIIGKKHVLTAGHCNECSLIHVYPTDFNHGWKSEIKQWHIFHRGDLAVIESSDIFHLYEDGGSIHKAVLGTPSKWNCQHCFGEGISGCAGPFQVSGYGLDPASSELGTIGKTTTLKCVKNCKGRRHGHVCAVSDKDVHRYDACQGDSGGNTHADHIYLID